MQLILFKLKSQMYIIEIDFQGGNVGQNLYSKYFHILSFLIPRTSHI